MATVDSLTRRVGYARLALEVDMERLATQIREIAQHDLQKAETLAERLLDAVDAARATLREVLA